MTSQQRLPHMTGSTFLTDAGLETSLIYDQGVDVPHFAAVALLRTEAGRSALTSYFEDFPPIAALAGAGLLLETPTWRASPDWAEPIGLSPAGLDSANLDAVALVAAIRDQHERPESPIAVSGCLGPRGDGYTVTDVMDAQTSRAYHSRQTGILATGGVDMVSALTMTYVAEATGIVLAARDVDVPVVISFTVETDGRLPSGQALGDAVRDVDDATDGYPAYYMINCAHPSHFGTTLTSGVAWNERVKGLRANASRRSHAELDAATELDAGDPVELADAYGTLRRHVPWLSVFGGCCGTNRDHIAEMARHLTSAT